MRAEVLPDWREFLVDTSFTSVPVPGDQFDAAVASDGANFLVAWTDVGRNYSIWGCRITADGVVLDSAGFAISNAGNCGCPAVAFDGANYLVVWQDRRNGTADIYAARVTPEGDGRSGTTGIYASHMTPDGILRDSFLVVPHGTGPGFPSLVSRGATQLLLVYQRWTSVVDGTAYNANRIWGKLGPFPGVDESQMLTTDGSPPLATIVSRKLFADSHQPVVLLDALGRWVTKLRPGVNDVSRLAPGVYFGRPAQGGRRTTLKIVVAR